MQANGTEIPWPLLRPGVTLEALTAIVRAIRRGARCELLSFEDGTAICLWDVDRLAARGLGRAGLAEWSYDEAGRTIAATLGDWTWVICPDPLAA